NDRYLGVVDRGVECRRRWWVLFQVSGDVRSRGRYKRERAVILGLRPFWIPVYQPLGKDVCDTCGKVFAIRSRAGRREVVVRGLLGAESVAAQDIRLCFSRCGAVLVDKKRSAHGNGARERCRQDEYDR